MNWESNWFSNNNFTEYLQFGYRAYSILGVLDHFTEEKSKRAQTHFLFPFADRPVQSRCPRAFALVHFSHSAYCSYFMFNRNKKEIMQKELPQKSHKVTLSFDKCTEMKCNQICENSCSH